MNVDSMREWLGIEKQDGALRTDNGTRNLFMSEHKKIAEHICEVFFDIDYMAQFFHQRVFWYSWRNKRRSFDGTFAMPPFMFFPRALPIELKGIAV